MAICGIAQGLLIKKARARDPKKINELRRQLREHAKKCEYCKKMLKRKR